MVRLLWFTPLLLLPMIAACDRDRASGASTTAGSAVPASSVAPASAGTVALSGAIRDLPASTSPDSIPAPPAAPAGGVLPRSPNPVERAVRPPPPVDLDRGESATSQSGETGESREMREFREAQAQRDRELLERDLRREQAAEAPLPREEDGDWADEAGNAPAPDDRRFEEEPYDPELDELPPEDYGPEDELPPDEDLPPDDAPPYEDELPPGEDDDLIYDPETDTWR